jgi:hypothetical protein
MNRHERHRKAATRKPNPAAQKNVSGKKSAQKIECRDG